MKNNNKQLFNELIKPNLKFVDSIVRYYSTLSDEDNDEIKSELNEVFLKYIHTYNPEKDLKLWIGVVSKRHVYDYIKRFQTIQSKKSEVPDKIDFNEWAQESSFGKRTNVFDLEYYKNNLSDEVYNALIGLDDIHRVPFLLRYVEGYSIAEITQHEYSRGAIEWLSTNAIKTRIKTSLAKIKENYKIQEKKSQLKQLVHKINKTNYEGSEETVKVPQPPYK